MEHGRLFVDSAGVEWEVYDESQWNVTMALDWDYPPQMDDPGLIFNSTLGRRRIWPCPVMWQALSDPDLESLCQRARTLV